MASSAYSYVLGSGDINTARVGSFEVGETYKLYDPIFFSGYTVAGSPSVEHTAESLGAVSGHYYYKGTSSSVATAANSPAGAASMWTQKMEFEPSYGSSVTYENQSYDITFGDGYYSLLSKSENSLKVNFNLNFNKRSDREAKALIFLLESSFNKGEKPSGAYTGIYHTPFAPYNNEHEFYIEEFDRSFDYPNVNTVATKLFREDASILNWQEYYIPFSATKGYFEEGESYTTHDIAYLSGTLNIANDRFKPHQSGWYYYSGDSTTVADTINSPTGTNSLWTKKEFYFNLNKGVSIKEAPRFLKQPTQSDYYIRTKDGLNKSLLNLTFSLEGRDDNEAKAIVHFLESHKGRTQFDFTPPAPYDLTGKAFVCPKWEHSLVFKDNNNISVNFIENPINLIEQSVAFKSLVTADPYFSTNFS
jgi:phage-related protein